MQAPFKPPVRLEDETFLVAADCELIGRLLDTTPAEREYIVKAVNAYQKLQAIDALAQGRFDDPALEAFGPLLVDLRENLLHILKEQA